ncbi:MAG: ABC transporter permease [Myxococcales bacterium]|nr:ABC transporter permease [Myxococcales bacterium]
MADRHTSDRHTGDRRRDDKVTGHPLWELTAARLREFVREPAAVFWVFGFPLVLAIGLGIAFRNKPPERVKIAVDGRLPDAAEVAKRLSKGGRIDARVLPHARAERALERGEVGLVIAPPTAAPPKASAAPQGAKRAALSLSYRFDPSAPESQRIRLAVDDALQRAYGRVDVVAVVDVPMKKPGARYIDFLIPGLLGLNLMGSSMWGLGYSIVHARSHKLLKRYAATPMNRAHYLMSYALSRLVFLTAEVTILVVFGFLVFDVTLKGSVFALAGISLVGATSFAGISLLIASRPTTIEGVSGWMNFVMMPMWLLSGSFFSYERFPDALHLPIKLLPLTALNDALRAVMNEGRPLWATWPELCVMVGWGVGSFVIALKIFRWR